MFLLGVLPNIFEKCPEGFGNTPVFDHRRDDGVRMIEVGQCDGIPIQYDLGGQRELFAGHDAPFDEIVLVTLQNFRRGRWHEWCQDTSMDARLHLPDDLAIDQLRQLRLIIVQNRANKPNILPLLEDVLVNFLQSVDAFVGSHGGLLGREMEERLEIGQSELQRLAMMTELFFLLFHKNKELLRVGRLKVRHFVPHHFDNHALLGERLGDVVEIAPFDLGLLRERTHRQNTPSEEGGIHASFIVRESDMVKEFLIHRKFITALSCIACLEETVKRLSVYTNKKTHLFEYSRVSLFRLIIEHIFSILAFVLSSTLDKIDVRVYTRVSG